MILNLIEKMKTCDTEESPYLYDNIPVPRVTHILSAMLHEDYLMTWSNALGLYRHRKYKDEINKASSIGTLTHNYIERYINDTTLDITKEYIEQELSPSVINGVQSFILWYTDVCKNNTVEILGMEQKLSCPWYGGTYDLLIKISGKIYLVDFKTSNHVSYKYFLQLAAYRYILETYHNIKLDGCLILQVDKKYPSYEEYVLCFDNPYHMKFIEQCTETFFSLVYAYHNRYKTEAMYKNIFK